MTVYYVGNLRLPDGNAACQRVLSNARLIEMCDRKVIVVSTSPDVLGCSQCVQGINTVFRRRQSSFLGRIISRLIDTFTSRFLCRNVEYGDTLIFYNASSLLILLGFVLCKTRSGKLILDLTEYYSTDGMPLLSKLIKNLDIYFRMNYAVKMADGVITTSPYLTRKYEKINQCVVELPTLFDCDLFEKNAAPTSTTLKFIYCGTPFTVSRRHVKERLDRVINFMDLLKRPWRLDVYGATKEEFQLMYPDYVVRSRPNAGVFFHGRRPQQEVRAALRESQVQIFFRDATKSNLAGFPTKFSEAISSGLLVVTTDLDGISSYTSHPFVACADPGSEGDLVSLIDSWEPARVDELRDLAFKSRLFDFRRYDREIAKLITSLDVI